MSLHLSPICVLVQGWTFDVQVRRLGVEIAADRHATRVQVEEHFLRLAHLLQACSPNLRALRLRLLQATKFRDYETNLLGPSQLERIMVSLHIWEAFCTSLLALLCFCIESLFKLLAVKRFRNCKHVRHPAG